MQRARREVEVRVPRAGAVIGKVERFHDQFISPLAAAAAEMQHHSLDDANGSAAMLENFFEMTGEGCRYPHRHHRALLGSAAPPPVSRAP